MPVSSETVNGRVKYIKVRVEVAGRTLTKRIDPPLANRTAEFVWDGTDYLGRPVFGTVTAHTSVGYVYPSTYMKSGFIAASFGMFGTDITDIPTRDEGVTWKKRDVEIHRMPPGEIAEGWTLSNHHSVNPEEDSILYKGDGSQLKKRIDVITTVVGTGEEGHDGDGGPASQAKISKPASVIFDAEGNMYIASQIIGSIRKVDRNGIITTIAGGPTVYSAEDGVPAVNALVRTPNGMDMDKAGNLYFADSTDHRVRMIDVNGIITTVAGNGEGGNSGDGGPALMAGMNPTGVAVDSSGNIYIADMEACRVRKVNSAFPTAWMLTFQPLSQTSGGICSKSPFFFMISLNLAL